jgi:hypothetical protein
LCFRFFLPISVCRSVGQRGKSSGW